MDAKLKADWVKELRSGKYSQCTSKLRVARRTTDGEIQASYCCLGVLAETMGAEWCSFGGPLIGRSSIKAEHSDHLQVGACKIPHGLQAQLANMNDSGKSFPEIADWIESNIPSDEQSKSVEPSHV